MTFSIVGTRTVRYVKISPKVVNARDVAVNAKDEEEEEVTRCFQSLTLKKIYMICGIIRFLYFDKYVKHPFPPPHAHSHTHMHARTRACTHVSTHAHTHTHTHTHTRKYAHAHTYTHTHTHTHAHTHTHTHTHTH